MRLLRSIRFVSTLLIPLSLFVYLDPGSGSFILQLIIGGVVGLLVAVKAFWGRIKSFFTRGGDVMPEEESDAPRESM